jgi:sugar phosphate isomerase/epimerase
MKIGIRGHDLKANNPKELGELCNFYEFNYLQLVLKKSFGKNIEDLKPADINDIIFHLSKSKVKIAMLGAYFNPVHSNLSFRETNIARFKRHLELAGRFGTIYVGTETGSYQDEPWTYHPRNHLEESYLEVREIIRDLVHHAEHFDSCVLIEGAYNHLIYKPELLKRLIDDIPSKNLRVTVDLFNYLNIENYQEHRKIFETSLKLLEDKISVIHLKDFVVLDGALKQVGLGQGLMDYPHLFRKIKENVPEAVLIFEGVTGEDIEISRQYIKKMEEINE